jgi:hypothetical protein
MNKQQLLEAYESSNVMLQVVIDGVVMGTIPAKAREFSTGSLGFYASGKVTGPGDNRNLQVSANLVGVKTKNM